MKARGTACETNAETERHALYCQNKIVAVSSANSELRAAAEKRHLLHEVSKQTQALVAAQQASPAPSNMSVASLEEGFSAFGLLASPGTPVVPALTSPSTPAALPASVPVVTSPPESVVDEEKNQLKLELANAQSARDIVLEEYEELQQKHMELSEQLEKEKAKSPTGAL